MVSEDYRRRGWKASGGESSRVNAAAVSKVAHDDNMQLSDFLSEAERTNAKECDRHSDQNRKVLPVFEKMRAAQNDGAA
jgi:hypothetical protein